MTVTYHFRLEDDAHLGELYVGGTVAPDFSDVFNENAASVHDPNRLQKVGHFTIDQSLDDRLGSVPNPKD